jgi:hypothetical protein
MISRMAGFSGSYQMNATTRRRFLRCTALAPLAVVAGCSMTGTTTTVPTPTTLASDATLLANAMAAMEADPTIAASPLFAQVQKAAATVAADEAAVAAASSPTTVQTAGSDILNVVEAVAPAVIGLFPGGGTIVTIAQAALSLLPAVAGFLGLSGASKISPAMTVPEARGVLAALPKSPRLA